MINAEKIEKNWSMLFKIIDSFITSPRKEKLISMYEDLSEEMIMLPASGKASFHNAFPGGYVDHVIRVVQCSLKAKQLWQDMGANIDFSDEELVFAALNHDLGKVGVKGSPSYIPQTDNWRKDKLGELYTPNKDISFMLIQDRSLFTLQKYGISITENEYLAIKLHDGLYDEVNKPYYMSYNPDSRLRSNMTYILHQGDFLASKIEYDNWKKLEQTQESKPVQTRTSTGKKTTSSEGLLNMVKNL